MRTSSIAILLVLGLVACQPTSNELTEVQRAEIQAAVLEADAGWWEAWASMENLDDYKGYFSDWFETPITGWASTEALRTGGAESWEETASWEYAPQP